MAAGPTLGVAVFWMVGIGDDVEEVGMAVDAADILGRSGARAVDAAGAARRGFECKEPFELDDMLPVVAEVVDVEKAEAFAVVEIAQAYPCSRQSCARRPRTRVRRPQRRGTTSRLSGTRASGSPAIRMQPG